MKQLIFMSNVPENWNIKDEGIKIGELSKFIFSNNNHINHYYYDCIINAFNDNASGQEKAIAYNIVVKYKKESGI